MSMNIIDILEKTYEDKCDIYRFATQKVNGITKSVRVLMHEGINCALSKDSLSKARRKNVTEIESDHTVFFNPDVDVREGDILYITQKGRAEPREFNAGETFLYSISHQEVRVSRNDKI